ncbi:MULTISPECIES: hypothetical protein [unclassified Knoellia]|uniref:hypothetical protein n=1 Tax=Knoellia altitudinis TaxID=3404795 RepID=UPI00361A9780
MKFFIALIVIIALVALYLRHRGSSGVSGDEKSVPKALGQSHRGGPGGGGSSM